MPNRLIASLIFAALAVPTVIAVFVLGLDGDVPSGSGFVFRLAAVSAALSGALFGNTFGRNHQGIAALIGALAMLLAQVPFAVLLVLILASEGPGPDGAGELIEGIGMILVFGWIFAGLYQIAFGALAGWLTHRLTRTIEHP